MLISVTGGRFPRAVRESPRRKLLRGLTWTRFSRWSRRLSLQSPTEGIKINKHKVKAAVFILNVITIADGTY